MQRIHHYYSDKDYAYILRDYRSNYNWERSSSKKKHCNFFLTQILSKSESCGGSIDPQFSGRKCSNLKLVTQPPPPFESRCLEPSKRCRSIYYIAFALHFLYPLAAHTHLYETSVTQQPCWGRRPMRLAQFAWLYTGRRANWVSFYKWSLACERDNAFAQSSVGVCTL